MGGIAAGTAGWPVGAMTAAVVAAATLAHQAGLTRPGMTAAAILAVLGCVHGRGIPLETCIPGEGWSGTVVERPRVREDWQQAVVDDGDGCRGLLTTDRWLQLPVGSTVRLSGGERQTLTDAAAFSAGYANYLARQNIQFIWRWPNVRTEVGRRDRLHLLYAGAQRRISSVFYEPDAGIVRALLLADRSALSDSLTDQFRRVGVSHVLAISGLHVSVLMGIFYGAVLLLPLSVWPRLLFVGALLWGYVLFIGAPVSAVRASIFWTLAGLALASRQLVSLPSVFMAAAAAMLTMRPDLAADAGWQLSFAAVAGIFLLLFLLRPRLHALGEKGGLRPLLLGLSAVSAGAVLTTWPLSLYHFGSISFVGLPANMIIVPVSSLTLVLAAVVLLLSGVWQPAGLAVSFVVHLLVTVMDRVTAWLSRMPYASLDEVSLPVWMLVLYYVALFAASVFWLRRQERSWREVWVS